METGSDHRELAEERWSTASGLKASEDSAAAAPWSEHQEAPQRPSTLRVLRELSWIEFIDELKSFTSSLKPLAMEKYRSARRTGARERVFKKGSVVDEAS